MKHAFLIGAVVLGLVGTGLVAQSFKLSATDLVGQSRAVAAQKATNPIPQGKGFDFYVLALSWSPTHCAEPEVARRDVSQCGGSRPFAFVVHGLWPQFETGYPRSCQTTQRGPDRRLVQSMLDIMPSERLVQIQWERHGTCSGLSAPDYFKVVRAASNAIAIPENYKQSAEWRRVSVGEVEQAFVQSNPKLATNSIAVERRRNLLKEVRICLTRNLQPRDCLEVDASGEPDSVRLAIPAYRN